MSSRHSTCRWLAYVSQAKLTSSKKDNNAIAYVSWNKVQAAEFGHKLEEASIAYNILWQSFILCKFTFRTVICTNFCHITFSNVQMVGCSHEIRHICMLISDIMMLLGTCTLSSETCLTIERHTFISRSTSERTQKVLSEYECECVLRQINANQRQRMENNETRKRKQMSTNGLGQERNEWSKFFSSYLFVWDGCQTWFSSTFLILVSWA